jgi:HD-like signal output (HDOD) protein
MSMNAYKDAMNYAAQGITMLIDDVGEDTDQERMYKLGLSNALGLVEHAIKRAKELESHEGERLT